MAALTGSLASFLFACVIYLAVRLARLSERVARIEGRLNGKHNPES